MALSLNKKNILVTGAGSGLGQLLAVTYAKEGAQVLLLGRNQDKLNQTYDTIVSHGYPTPIIVPLDLQKTNESQLHELSLMISNELGGLNGIVHCASRFMPLGSLSSQPVEQWKEVFNCNVMGAFALTKALFSLLDNASDASVLFTIEHHGLTLPPFWGGFGLSQHTVVGLMQLFAREYQNRHHLRFNLIAPGPIATPMRIRTHPGEIHQHQRMPENILEPFVYWMSEESKGKTGNIIELSNYAETA